MADYVDIYGNILTKRIDQVVDKLRVRLSLDINDVPYKPVGIHKNMSEPNQKFLIEKVKSDLLTILSDNEFSDCQLTNVSAVKGHVQLIIEVSGISYTTLL